MATHPAGGSRAAAAAPAAPEPAAAAVEVVGVDRVGADVVVVVAGTAGFGIGLQESAGGRVVEADAHEDDLGEGVAGVALVGT